MRVIWRHSYLTLDAHIIWIYTLVVLIVIPVVPTTTAIVTIEGGCLAGAGTRARDSGVICRSGGGK